MSYQLVNRGSKYRAAAYVLLSTFGASIAVGIADKLLTLYGF